MEKIGPKGLLLYRFPIPSSSGNGQFLAKAAVRCYRRPRYFIRDCTRLSISLKSKETMKNSPIFRHVVLLPPQTQKRVRCLKTRECAAIVGLDTSLRTVIDSVYCLNQKKPCKTHQYFDMWSSYPPKSKRVGFSK